MDTVMPVVISSSRAFNASPDRVIAPVKVSVT